MIGINYIILTNRLNGRSGAMLNLFVNPVLIAAAILPAIVLLIKVYQADKVEKEPPRLLFSLVLYGILATGLAMVIEQLGSWLLAGLVAKNSIFYNFIFYFIVVAFSEEGFKYILLKKRTWHSSSFNCQFDGVVYAVFLSLGFALWENISYVAMYGLQVALLRAVTAVPGHACFGVFMGVWYGFAKKYEQRSRYELSKQCRIFAVLLPAVLHGCYDFIASFGIIHYAWVFVMFVAILFVVAFRLVKILSEKDCYIRRRHPHHW